MLLIAMTTSSSIGVNPGRPARPVPDRCPRMQSPSLEEAVDSVA
jgi:hypothetical protein